MPPSPPLIIPRPKPMISTTHPTLHLHHRRTLPTFTWNTILRSPPSPHSPLSIYSLMRRHLVPPDSHTFPFLLSASASATSPSLAFPSDIHAQAFLFNLSSHPHSQTSLIDAYSSRGDFEHARRVFEEARRFSYVIDLASWNAVINGCLKVGLLVYARKVFDEMPGRNVRSWSCMINGYVTFGEYKEALGLFRRMQVEESWVRPNEFTMSGVLSACGKLGALEHGNWVQEYIDRCGMKVDVVLGTCLIDMYSKCGCVDRAMLVFRRLKGVKDVTVWTAMISGLAMNGMGNECFALFSEMCKFGVQPNAVTILGVLCGCVHGGMVTEGEELFSQMEEVYELVPMIQHYGCLIDLYARAGSIDKAWNVVRSMPIEPDVLIWGALLSGARTHGDKQTCEIALRRIIELDPSNSGAYILLSNLYAKMGRWSDVRSVRNSMEAHGISKVPGCSLVELNGVLHEFFVGDDTHLESREIYMMLDEIILKLKKEGYVGNTNEVLLDLDEEGKEVALSLHSEKVAVAFCFLKTSPGTPIRIIKNLRICLDCHVAMKMISKVYKREIVVRDCNRFHHFHDGVCSCKDFW